MNRNTDPASGRASALGVDHAAPSMTIFKTCPKPCRWKVCADVGAFCRKGLRSPAATRQVSTPKSCRRRSQHRFLLCHATSRFRFALRQIGKSFPAERNYRNRLIALSCGLLFPYATRRRSTTGLLELMPRSQDRRASARLASTATTPLRSTVNLAPRHSSALAKSKPYYVLGSYASRKHEVVLHFRTSAVLPQRCQSVQC